MERWYQQIASGKPCDHRVHRPYRFPGGLSGYLWTGDRFDESPLDTALSAVESGRNGVAACSRCGLRYRSGTDSLGRRGLVLAGEPLLHLVPKLKVEWISCLGRDFEQRKRWCGSLGLRSVFEHVVMQPPPDWAFSFKTYDSLTRGLRRLGVGK